MLQKTKNVYHLCIAILANIVHKFPGRKLLVIGVTGTDGKTTTASLIYHILKTAGLHVSLISSVQAIIHDKTYDTGFHVTNPTSFPLQRFLKKTVQPDRAKNYLVLEVTSHGIDQHRIWGIPFAIGVLTNITHEHLDYHKTYEKYVKAKVKLLKNAKVAVLNRDDKSYPIVLPRLRDKRIITYAIHHEDATVSPKKFSFKTNLIGEYNTYNILAAIAVCKELGIADGIIKNAIQTFIQPVGRGEIVYKKDFTVMIDFAHTPNAFEQILSAVRPSVKGRLIHVFGAAGQRDGSKRPIMGEISAKYADVIVLTAEDPRKESIDKINKEIAEGVQNSEFRIQNVKEIPNRQEAITAAVTMARAGDFVLLTGKAHEASMNYGHGEEPWSEHEAVEKALKSKYE